MDFETKVDWKESHKMLRVHFPVNVFSERASFDIQYGYVKRNTHKNTSWDRAKFEVVGHKYADSRFLKKCNENQDQRAKVISDETIQMLANYSWPGNICDRKCFAGEFLPEIPDP